VAFRPIAPLPAGTRRKLVLRREISRLLSPLTIPLIGIVLRWLLGYRIEDLRDFRREYRRICLQRDGPVMICANHLTMIDSIVIAWALGSPWWYFRHFRTLPWNVPERSIFAATRYLRAAIYALKCLPVERGGNRAEVTEVLTQLTDAVSNHEVALIFPEAGRSRTGRVDPDSAASGVGRIYRSVPGCRVLCVYLRGDHQDGYSNTPVRGECFRGSTSVVEPKTSCRGLRASRDVARQISQRLADMEQEYFDDRQ
jgi:1-acyl-sn-glycerol-3-phosphate acyltransferase